MRYTEHPYHYQNLLKFGIYFEGVSNGNSKYGCFDTYVRMDYMIVNISSLSPGIRQRNESSAEATD